MSSEKFKDSNTTEKDQLLDQLLALDKNNPAYEQEKDIIEKELNKISQNPEETIKALNRRAEIKLSPVDKYQAAEKYQELEDAKAVDQLLGEISSIAPTNFAEQKPNYAEQAALYFRPLSNTAQAVKKAIRAFNWRSFRQIPKVEKENLCAQIDRIVMEAKVEAAKQYQEAQADTITINRVINEARYQIQKIADDRHIKIPEEY